jgi:hypothetical protein
MGIEQPDGAMGQARFQNAKLALFQHPADEAPDAGFIFYDENVHGCRVLKIHCFLAPLTSCTVEMLCKRGEAYLKLRKQYQRYC